MKKHIFLDDSISTFNNFINDNIDYIYKIYNLDNNKNLFNCICSCINWIEVSKDYINNIEYDETNFNKKCMQIYLYISSIDIIYEAIVQLNRVIYGKSSNLLKGDNTIFNYKLELDDNNYFKEIRAVFGAHPVNLKSKNNDIKYFASWPLKSHFDEEYDFYCNLYTNSKDGNDKKLGFKICQLDKFLLQRYAYLNIFKDKIETDIKLYLDKSRKTLPKLCNDSLENIKNLRKHLESIFQNAYYENILNDLKIIIETYKTYTNKNYIIDCYIKELDKVILEIYNNLSICSFKELKYDYIINPYVDKKNINTSKFPKNMYNYYLEKLNNYIYLGNNYNFKNKCINAINSYFNGEFKLDYNMTRDELLLELKSGIFYFNLSKKI